MQPLKAYSTSFHKTGSYDWKMNKCTWKYQEMYREDIMITVLLRLQVINVNLMVKKLDRNISYKLFL